MAMELKFTYSDVRHAVDDATFNRAVGLFSGGKVGKVNDNRRGFGAEVSGTEVYSVEIDAKKVNFGFCDCYMGENDQLCKHMIALALAVLYDNNLVDKDGLPVGGSVILPADAKKYIAKGMAKITSYNGPSSTWFTYQNKLDVGAGMICEGVELLEPNLENVRYLWKFVLRLSKKMSHGGVDDSNGTVGGAVSHIINKMVELSRSDQKYSDWVRSNCREETGFGWEEDLQDRILREVRY